MKPNQSEPKQQIPVKPSPEELVDSLLTEGAPEQGKLHLACVDGRHSGVTKTTNTQRGLQLHLRSSFSPQPANKGRAGC